MDNAALVVVVVVLADVLVEVLVLLVDTGLVGVVKGAVAVSVLVSVVVSVVVGVSVAVVDFVESPPVIVEPVIGIGVVISVLLKGDEEVGAALGTVIFVIEKSGLVLPESPNTICIMNENQCMHELLNASG